MATINLGSIKFNWKGTYGGGTPYVVDDVVEYNGSSYICIQASTGNLPTDTAYFEQMSSAGTNGTDGTDLTTTLTTQGDLVYRDGSGLQRLGAGTSGQVLQTGGTGANPSWTDIAGGTVKQIVFAQNNSTTNTTSSSFVTTNFGVNITKQSATSKILLLANVNIQLSGSSGRWTIYRDNATNIASVSGADEVQTSENANAHNPATGIMIDEATLSTGTYNYTIYFRNSSGSNTTYFNPTNQTVNSLIAVEYEV